MSWGRILLGGFLSGVVINVLEGVGGMLYGKELEQSMVAHNIRFDELSPASMVLFLVLGFLAGFGGVWLYAAILPRFGPGFGTALKAGALVWLVGYFSSAIGFTALGVYPAKIFLMVAVIGLTEIVLGTYLGSRIYREA